MSSCEEMVRKIGVEYGLQSPQVLSAMLRVPREQFVPEKYRLLAYEDRPIGIGFGQTISQPYTVAFMTDLLLQGTDFRRKVLEIGTGSGYQTAILAELFEEVYSLEIIPQLARRAGKVLKKLGYDNFKIKVGSGEKGWRQYSPYDAILVTAGMLTVPQLLLKQLKIDGVLVAPVGKEEKTMTRFHRSHDRQACFKKETFGVFSFVPFISQQS